MVKMFGADLYQDKNLLPVALDLLGKGESKPLECVGLYEESVAAAWLMTKKLESSGQEIPPLLAEINSQVLTTESDLDQKTAQLLSGWNDEHALPEELATTLKSNLENTKLSVANIIASQ